MFRFSDRKKKLLEFCIGNYLNNTYLYMLKVGENKEFMNFVRGMSYGL